LYDPAFATLTGLYGRAARGPITGITLIAGFASTVGWPLSAVLDAQFGWRAACLIWAALHIVIGAAAEPAADPAGAATRPCLRGGRRGVARPGRCDGDPGFSIWGDVVCHRRYGGTSTAPPRNRRSQHDGGDCRRCPGRTGAGCSSSRRVRGAAQG